MRITFVHLLIVLLFAATRKAAAQVGSTLQNSQYEYVMIALEGPTLVGPLKVRIYYGMGKVEDFRQVGTLPGVGSTDQEQDMIVSAINYLAEKGYEFVTALENDRDAEDSINHRYLLRREK